ncbi:MAG: Hsp33 family molecular chaperone HslO [Bacillota bacterium]|nr:Hsp33 family molecular chaperone HslO [Bacillota bacterium]
MSLNWDDPRLAAPDDYLVTALAADGRVRLVACRSRAVVQEAQRLHGLSPLSTLALGRFLTGGLLFASSFKEEHDNLTMRLDCSGPLRSMTVIAEGDGSCRGEIAEPQLPSLVDQQGRLAVRAAVEGGRLTVIRDLGLREPYVGTVPLVSGEIAQDLISYLYHSEQRPGVMFLSVDLDGNQVHDAAGLLLEALPGVDDALLERIEQRVAGFPEISYWLREGFSPAQLMDLLMGDPGIHLLELREVSYRCRCSRERMRRNLAALGLGDREELAADPDGIDLICHFCNRSYHFSQTELGELLP